MSSGRSPYPTRSRRRQQALQHQQQHQQQPQQQLDVSGASESTTASSLIPLDDSTVSISPRRTTTTRDSIGSVGTSTTIASGSGGGSLFYHNHHHRMGQSLVQARISPRAAATAAASASGGSNRLSLGSTATATSTTSIAPADRAVFFGSNGMETSIPSSTTTKASQSSVRRIEPATQLPPPKNQLQSFRRPTVELPSPSQSEEAAARGKSKDSIVRGGNAIGDGGVGGGGLSSSIQITQLRGLAKSCLHTSSVSTTMAVYYASLVHAQSGDAEDTILYAQALLANGEYKRCVRLLEQAGVLTSANGPSTRPTTMGSDTTTNTNTSTAIRWEATLIATQALALMEEWTSILSLLEDPYLYHTTMGSSHNIHHHAGANVARVIDDEDEIAWQHLAEQTKPSLSQAHLESDIKSKTTTTTTATTMMTMTIHPLARICTWRGRAYAETGHPVRAALYWKRALQIDVQCVDAWHGLLESSPVMTPSQALSMVLHDLTFLPHQSWLRAMFLARIHVAAPTTYNTPPKMTTSAQTTNHSLNHTNYANHTTNASTTVDVSGVHHGRPSSSFWHDASSIQLLTPISAKPDVPKNNVDDELEDNHDGDDMEGHDHIFFGSNNADMDQNQNQNEEEDDDLVKNAEELETALDTLLTDYGLSQSSEVLSMAAKRAYRQSDLKRALHYCQTLARLDPLCTNAAYVHVATLVALGQKRTLFRLAHEWVEAAPKSARAWFAVGSYYYACKRYHVAQRHYCRATRLDPNVVDAWIAFGVSFAACDESDQALASFRAAQRLAPGHATPLLYMGMEYLRTNHASLAHHFLTAAYQSSCGTHRLACNELGVWYLLTEKDYVQATHWLLHALCNKSQDVSAIVSSPEALQAILDTVQDVYWEPTLFNLAHALRKRRLFGLAILCLERCQTLQPSNTTTTSSILSAWAFCHQLQGQYDQAIDGYHQALAQKPDDPFASDMLGRCLHDALLYSTTELFENIGLEDKFDVSTTMSNNNNNNGNANNTSIHMMDKSASQQLSQLPTKYQRLLVGGVRDSSQNTASILGRRRRYIPPQLGLAALGGRASIGEASAMDSSSFLTDDGALDISVDTAGTSDDIDMG